MKRLWLQSMTAGSIKEGFKNLRSDEDVCAAYAEIVRRVQAIEPPPRGAGLLIQPMVGAGVEVMVGARIDPLFGALLVVGFGGIFVEILRDSALARTRKVTHSSRAPGSDAPLP